MQRKEVFGQSILSRRGASGLVYRCYLLVLNGHLGPSHSSSIGVLVIEIGEEL